MEKKPVIIMTAGDPWSITSEAWARLLLRQDAPFSGLLRLAANGRLRLIACGSRFWLDRQWRALGLNPEQVFDIIELVDDGIAVTNADDQTLFPADASTRGAHAVAALHRAVALSAQIPSGNLAVVTGPVDKKSCSLAGFGHPGQTEFFEASWGPASGQADGALMLLAGPKLRVGLATRHLPLKDVPGSITPELVASQTAILASALKTTFAIDRPRIAVAGLNPHAGDRGLFGDEEELAIKPGIESARFHPACDNAELSGPHSGDTIFYEAWSGRYDAVLAMYHDQGLAPLKALHFNEAVNISAGLPHLRVSPDHGPASALFLTGKADTGSFDAAFRVACSHLSLASEHEI